MKKIAIVLFGLFIVFAAGYFAKQYLIKPNATERKTYQNKEYNFSFKYPSSIKIETKTDSNFHISLNEKDQKILRLHVYKEIKKDESEFKRKSEVINNNLFDVLLFPAGLDSGEVKLTQPILYYILYQDGLKFSFEFNNQNRLTSLQTEILSSFKYFP